MLSREFVKVNDDFVVISFLVDLLDFLKALKIHQIFYLFDKAG